MSILNKSIFIKLFFVALLLTSECCFFQNKWLPEGGCRPKNPNFKLAKKNNFMDMGSQIDTNAIYLFISNSDNPDKYSQEGTDLIFYRFFNNGRVFRTINILNHFPTNFDVNDLRAGLGGYYQIDSNILSMEVFSPWQGGKYMQSEWEVFDSGIKNSDGLFCYKVKDSAFKFTAQPDW